MPARKKSSRKSSPSKTYNYNYGKKPLWQWIVLYIILGVIVYGLIYYFFLGNQGRYNYKSPAPTQNYQYQSK